MYGLAALPAVVLAAGATMHGWRTEGLCIAGAVCAALLGTATTSTLQHLIRLINHEQQCRVLPACSPPAVPSLSQLLAACTVLITYAARMLAGMYWLPESPRWLLLSGAGPKAAVAALRRTKGSVANDAAVQVGSAVPVLPSSCYGRSQCVCCECCFWKYGALVTTAPDVSAECMLWLLCVVIQCLVVQASIRVSSASLLAGSWRCIKRCKFVPPLGILHRRLRWTVF